MSDWLNAAKNLMNELMGQPTETQQSMQELSRRSYVHQEENPFEHDFCRMQFLEGSLSSAHVQQIRSSSTGMDDYLSNLESEYSAHCEAIARMRNGCDELDRLIAQQESEDGPIGVFDEINLQGNKLWEPITADSVLGTEQLLHTPTQEYWDRIFGE